MIRETIAKLDRYKAGKSVEEIRKKYGLKKVVKLASNENPYGASPEAIKAFKKYDSLHVYPDPDPKDLRERISEYTGFDESRIVVGAGVDGILESVFKIFVGEGDCVIIPVPSFPYYHILTKISGGKDIIVRRNFDFSINAEKILHSIDDRTRIVIICSPNNPTGNSENKEEVAEIVEQSGCIVFIDEAYAEFSSKNLLELAEYENVILARTFSKAFGLANLRIGYAIVPKKLRQYFLKVTTPFPVSTPAKFAAIAALEDIDYLRIVVERIKEERMRIIKELSKMDVKVYPSESNFILIETEYRSGDLCEELLKRWVIVRDCSGFIGCNDRHVRVSVGKKEENDFFIEKMEEIL
ncbi:MAG TPA: histidinol-phosphate transaminase [Archaeoglobaceae archaeon]|nr:histidinol-phosphate transaminase [Archaeoglobaceae archaeon]